MDDPRKGAVCVTKLRYAIEKRFRWFGHGGRV